MSSGRTSAISEEKNISEFNAKIDQLNLGVTPNILGSSQDDGQWEVVRKSKNRAGKPGTYLQPAGRDSDQSNPKNDQLSHGVADKSLESAQDDGEWEVVGKSKNRAGKPGMYLQEAGKGSGNPWKTHTADLKRPVGRGSARSQSSTIGMASIQSKGIESSQLKDESESPDKSNFVDADADEEEEDYSDLEEDSDDDMLSDDFESDSSQKSHDTRKKSKWLKKFFEILDTLTVEEINDPERQWHCPACQGGPGSIDWYRGLQPLKTHAKTKGSKRVKIHRELADLLDEELCRRGTSIIPAGEVFGKWKGINDEEKDHEIVWPPMVIIQNTQLEKDENDNWIGMGNQELLDYFSSYAAVKAQHSYGPKGHRGCSVLIFEPSASGYLEAERLHKHFTEQGTDRAAWCLRPKLFLLGGKRQLHGYMAVNADMVYFNQHSQGKSRLKYEMRSYQEMVVKQIRQMSEDNQQLIWLKNKVVKEQRHTKALEESFGVVSEKLRKTMEENHIVRQRTKVQHEENKEEMYMQEQFYKDQIKIVQESIAAKEENFERLQQEEREKVKQSNANPSNAEERRRRADEILKFIKLQDKEVEEFVIVRDRLILAHEENIVAMKRRQLEEELQMEEQFSEKLTKIMERYSPAHLETTANSS
ncbi:suppressor of gene silencing protein [Quillaja saponaria]|uniref:Suppressor of gene silencing protein n=1 Tax=Quillaja saponaria TaxID=32244 RepID=A0AAD7LGV1_QUISA|nr:suppressor of gene silencing protein [Quillaja saponaria]